MDGYRDRPVANFIRGAGDPRQCARYGINTERREAILAIFFRGHVSKSALRVDGYASGIRRVEGRAWNREQVSGNRINRVGRDIASA